MSKIPLHEFERAKKAKKIADGFLMFLAVVTILIGVGISVSFAAWLLSFLLPYPLAFWGVLIGGGLWFLWWAGLTIYEHYYDIVAEGERDGTLDE